MLGLFKKTNKTEELLPIQCADNEIVAPVDGEQIPIETVSDEVFAEKIMGDGIAFKLTGSEAIICSPVNGTLEVLYDTKHAFGITMDSGVEILIHIGIDTVTLKGEGFKTLEKKQGDKVTAGTPIIKVDLKKVGSQFDTTTMMIITNNNHKEICFTNPMFVNRGQVVGKIVSL